MTGPVVVVGDTLLDRDVEGTVNRLCPDSPVPVLDETTYVDRPGGAGLAAVFAAAAAGVEVALVTALADDAGGARIGALLAAAGVQLYALPLAGATPEKVRLRARGRVLLRHDRGGRAGEPGEPSEAVLRLLADAAAVLVSDYGRGVAGQPALRAALAATRAPVVWDPHPRGPAAVPGVQLATPNESEARELAKAPPGASRLVTAARGAQALRQRWQAGAVAVTLGGDGALLCHAGSTPLVVPAPAAEGDTCGAGDRFAATATLALARGALVSEAVQEAVAEASAYVAGGGVATALPAPVRAASPVLVSGGGDRIGAAAAGAVVAEVRAAGGTVVATGGCFDLLHAGHVATLQAARQLGDCLVVCLNSDASVAGLKGPERPVVPQGDRSRLLAALSCVDAVLIFDEPTPHAALSWLRPDIWVKGGDYATGGGEETLPEAEILARWGGSTVVVPYLDGRSTTDMIAAARSGRGSATWPVAVRAAGAHREPVPRPTAEGTR
ncbi:MULTISPECIES: PfkB family carbohydrate kinase [Micromonospora]|uniref:Bifunctional heptose 7-phosphate kinase/heptose 1-phosphate adenyltransferase n=1 Tax=Micromonospora solifontis TaxID=2487138 RepID=A0ABX9WJ55_9ACTN|nr:MULTISPECIES: PfkB family carbohydrate kinase [Micromonospora]NES13375.1 bifunctional heptose 7-phosphate kinase/heptose 1-phosphate adenyltransferase [Micromonospora sp. PPF5-17B]NES35773.1 bifunctional heptose 7-phosphate kinase/heptose 1-phosphate adenyltransferase [Micromonospora solifontis]NES55609.1 bifunctional heptose 7-phosphate kinase/heptose 1-phosphate adenyltransferase [Micromonospora sp. PPF5-6]RNM00256.1 bifunctional heptose 7-phosphate kinase/heptose 1-phosphate adenyltransfe